MLNRNLLLIFFSNFVGAFGEGLYLFLFPAYILELKADAVQLGAVFSILNLASALTIIPGGILTDKYDRKKIVFFSWLVWAFAPLAYSLADRWSQLFVGAALWGASMFGAPAITAYVIASVKKESVMSATSIVSASWTMGYVFSPALGGYLADVFSMKLVLHLSFILSLLCTSFYLFIASQRPKKVSVTQSPLILSLIHISEPTRPY